MHKLNITIIGAGVIGLTIARKLSQDYEDILVVEKNSSFGQEISSRNSINLIGIESPGLTSCLSIAKTVKTLINKTFKPPPFDKVYIILVNDLTKCLDLKA